MKGFVVAATGSGTGKTTVTLALLAWLKQKGFRTVPFKVGPDFIDPGHHARVSGRTSHNLDSWMLSKSYNRQLFYETASDSDMAVVEGVMGVFDGYDAVSDVGSTAQMAKWLGLPVLLIVSAKGKARSAAAVVKGFEEFDPDLSICGVVFTMTGSRRHYDYLRAAVEQNCQTPCLGYMEKNPAIVMPERHLGLTTAQEHHLTPAVLSALVDMVDQGVDMEGLIKTLPPWHRKKTDHKAFAIRPVVSGPSLRPRLAVARDKAFCFYYPENIRILKAAGADIVYFSPLADQALPDDIDGIYLGGGYPELSAQTLSQKKKILDGIRNACRSGMPIYGECGGFMFLCQSLSADNSNGMYAMAGCFEFSVSMSRQLRSLGYREVTLTRDTLIGKKGTRIRGHEFHYSSLSRDRDPEAENVYQVTNRSGQDLSLKGFLKANTLGSYLHVHFGSNPESAREFVKSCAGYKKIRVLDHG